MMNKYGFLNLLFGFLLISIFHFSLFSHAYIIILLGLTVVSTLFDIGWLIVRGSVTPSSLRHTGFPVTSPNSLGPTLPS